MKAVAVNLDTIFMSLADSTRRDILRRVIERPRSIGELAEPYKLTFAAIAKHIGILEGAFLITKKRQGRQQIISANPRTIDTAAMALRQYQEMLDARFDALDALLKQ